MKLLTRLVYTSAYFSIWRHSCDLSLSPARDRNPHLVARWVGGWVGPEVGQQAGHSATRINLKL
jgi:hypothetical protein